MRPNQQNVGMESGRGSGQRRLSSRGTAVTSLLQGGLPSLASSCPWASSRLMREDKGQGRRAEGPSLTQRTAGCWHPVPLPQIPLCWEPRAAGGGAAVPLACCFWRRSKRETHLLQGATRESLSQDMGGGGSKNPGPPREGEENVWGPGSYVSAKKWSATDEGGAGKAYSRWIQAVWLPRGRGGGGSGAPSLRPRCTGPAQDWDWNRRAETPLPPSQATHWVTGDGGLLRGSGGALERGPSSIVQ